MSPADVLLAAAIPLYLVAAGWDVALRIIPDSVPAALVLIGLASSWWLGATPVWTALAIGVGLFVGLALLAGPVLGGGDIKLLAATGVLLGPQRTVTFLLVTALAGGVLALLYLAARALLRRLPPKPLPPPPPDDRSGRRWAVLLAAERRRMRRGTGLPYGVAIAAGALATLAGLS